MTKPQSTRKSDILSKLEYANHRYQELMTELFEAKKSDRDPAYLVHTASEIIATVRECFDYLGQDIIEFYVIPYTQNSRIQSDYNTGKLRAYFPLHQSQVNGSGKLFNEVQHGSPQLYNDLVNFTDSIANNASIPNTLFEYSVFLEVKDMVNEKKHDKLIAVVSNEKQEHLIENETAKIIIPIQEQVGWNTFSVSPGTLVKQATEYRFDYNKKEVGRFCLFAVKATELVINKFYADHFA